MTKNDFISQRQLQALIVAGSLGVLSVTVPLGVTVLGGSGGWLFTAVGGVITAVIMAMAVSVDKTSLWLMEKPVGHVVSLIICGKIIFCAGVLLRYFSETIGQLLLPSTPSWLISFIMVLGIFYTGLKGEETRARFGEMAFGFIFLFLLFIFLLSAPNVEKSNLLPFTAKGGVAAALYTVSAAFGIEYLLFVTPYTNGFKRGKSVLTAGILSYGLISAAVAFTVGVFGIRGVAERRWPVLQIMDTIDFPLMILERQDVLMLGFWIGSIFLFLSGAVVYGGGILGRVSVKKERDRAMILAAAVLIFVVSLFPQNISQVTRIVEKARILNLITQGFIVAAFIFGGKSK